MAYPMNKQELIAEAKHMWDNTTYGTEFWSQRRKEVLYAIINFDIDSFLTWQVIQSTMYVTGSSYAPMEFYQIKDTPYGANLQVSKVGSPLAVPSNPGTCENTTHMLYHLYMYEQSTKIDTATYNSVIEFGGGYGCMAKLIKDRNPKAKYYIFDFPEFCLLQKYYLSQNGYDDVVFISDVDRLEHTNADLRWLLNFDDIGHTDTELLIATWSLSEAPIGVRQKFLAKVSAKNHLIAYQEKFFTINNTKFFTDMTRDKSKTWLRGDIPHLPPTQYYLFGVENKK
jgi:hypothetical protein